VDSRSFRRIRDPHLTRMVNDRFRAASIYGFEMVDAPAGLIFGCFSPSMEYLRRIESFDFSANLPQCKHLRFIERC
jgi:hypothetical protein